MRTTTPSSTPSKPDYRSTSGAGASDIALDNLWVTTKDSFVYNIFSGKPATLKKDPSGILIGKNQKYTGTIVYFLPKDKNGKLTDKPVRLLKVDNKVNTYLSGGSVAPSATSSFTGLDDIRNEMGYIGCNGLDVSNAEGLDDSIVNAIGGMTENYEYSSNCCGADGYSNLTNESLLNVSAKYFPDSKSKSANLSAKYFPDSKSGGVSAKYFPDKSRYSNLTNESLIDEYGTITNRSLIQKYSNLTNESLLDANGDSQYSNGVGDWFKGLFDGKDGEGVKGGDALRVVSDPNVSVVDAATMEKAYKESGSKKTYKDWISSEGGKGVMNAITQFANVFINRPTSDSVYVDPNLDPNRGGEPLKSETKILGMSPVTFGIVALAVVAIGSIVAIKIIKSKQGKK